MKQLNFKGHGFRFYDSYSTYDEAWRVANHYKKEIGCRYFILKKEVNWLFPNDIVELYMDKVEKGPLGITIIKGGKGTKRMKSKTNPLITIKVRKTTESMG